MTRRPHLLLVRLAILGGLLLIGSCRGTGMGQRAIAVPALASRTPDLALPLGSEDRELALYYLDGGRPEEADWELFRDLIEEEMQSVDRAAVEEDYGVLLDALGGPVPVEEELDSTQGRIGRLFDPAGADDEALDARLIGQILPGDLKAGLIGDHYFVFYRRHPGEGGQDEVCPSSDEEPLYCRLVIVASTATRRN